MKTAIKQETPGVTLLEDETRFSIYCPKAESMVCILYDSHDTAEGERHFMDKSDAGYWSVSLKGRLTGKWYAYQADFEELDKAPDTPYVNYPFADPYSRHVCVRNTYRQEARTLIFEDDYDWEGDSHCFPNDLRDLIIYETHLKDLTAHPSSSSKGKGSYQKFIDPQQKGGIAYLRELGVNCVEFLPLHKFPPIEPPFGKRTDEGFHNTWNVYSANYWGYMTSFFFAPESIYASDCSNTFSGKTTAAVNEFKDVVKCLHQNRISVIMDVVYNHTSLFDVNPLSHLAPDEYLRFNENGELMNRSGTGNEFRSENPIARKLIIDSLIYWIEEYHIDGFRFDLAALLDKKSWETIRREVHKKYPSAILIAEPWGGYYSPHHFSDHGWASWNDRIRNSLKGSDPLHDKGFIFSDWQRETRRERIENIFKGTLNHREGGLYNTSEHSVNYLESHDGYTLGDFIRIGINPELQDQVIENRSEHITLSEEEINISKLAAVSLFTAQGITMLHAGQEFARSKIIAKTPFADPETGKIDHNSYEKDNETNWINYEDITYNKPLYDYYRSLIRIRKQAPALRKCDPSEICFDHYANPLIISFYISGANSGDLYDYYIILNGTKSETARVHVPSGTWEVLVNRELASTQMIDLVRDQAESKPQSGLVLRKLRHT